MKPIRKLIDSLKPDRLTSTGSVFPEVEARDIATDLRLEERGRERGIQDLPGTDDKLLDSVESDVIAELGRLRMAGFNRLEEHMETYARRLREASNSKASLLTIAGMAVTDYKKSVSTWGNTISNPRERVIDRYSERSRFLKENGIWRTAHARRRLWISFSLVSMLVLIESVMNGYFFSSSNVLGLLGGISVAIVISIINVAFSMIFGYVSRNVNHIRWMRKFIGIIAIVSALLFSLSFNLSVAHFRDAAAILSWQDAVTAAILNFTAAPFALTSFESWLLLGIGILISVGAFWKGYLQDDPYPGYGHVQYRLEDARDDYAETIHDAVLDLENLRDDAIEDLEEARTTLASSLNEAVDIVYARMGLSNQLGVFLDHTEQVTNQLFAIYRDANRSKRKSPSPHHFNEPYAFPTFQRMAITNEPEQTAVEREIVEINAIVDKTVKDIFQRYEKAISSYKSIDELERLALSADK